MIRSTTTLSIQKGILHFLPFAATISTTCFSAILLFDYLSPVFGMDQTTDDIMEMNIYPIQPTRIVELQPDDDMPFTTLPSRPAQRRFPCTQCNLSFTRNASLKRHWNEAHVAQSMKPIHTCFHCMKSFPRPDTLSRHIAEKHLAERVKVVCDRCGKHIHRRYLTEHWNTSACYRNKEAASERRLLKGTVSRVGFQCQALAMDGFWSYADVLATSAPHRELMQMSPEYAVYYLLCMESDIRLSINTPQVQEALGLTYAVVRYACSSLVGPTTTAALRAKVIFAIHILSKIEALFGRDEAAAYHVNAFQALICRETYIISFTAQEINEMDLIHTWARDCVREELGDSMLVHPFDRLLQLLLQEEIFA